MPSINTWSCAEPWMFHMKRRNDPGLRLALDIAGSQAEIGRALGLTRKAVWAWHKVPEEHLWALAKSFGIAPQKLRPDLSDWKIQRLKQAYEEARREQR